MITFGLIGAGGHGRDSMPVAESYLAGQSIDEEYELVFVVEFGDRKDINGHKVLTLDEFVNLNSEKRFNISISNSEVRQRIADSLLNQSIPPFPIIAPSATILDQGSIPTGLIASPYSTLGSNITIGKFFHANLYSYVSHDCRIGDFVTFAPGVHCNGHIHIGDHAFIGSGAILKNGSTTEPLVIGERAIVGMGAVVTKSVPANTTVVGNPAKIHKGATVF